MKRGSAQTPMDEGWLCRGLAAAESGDFDDVAFCLEAIGNPQFKRELLMYAQRCQRERDLWIVSRRRRRPNVPERAAFWRRMATLEDEPERT